MRRWPGSTCPRRPAVDEVRFPEGVNVEVARVVRPGELEMRVYERGSGATLSCGTGAVAAAVAAAAGSAAGPGAVAGSAGRAGAEPGHPLTGPAGAWTVDMPGGRLGVTLSATTSLLTGPAVIVAEGELSEAWLAGRAAAPRRPGLAARPTRTSPLMVRQRR